MATTIKNLAPNPALKNNDTGWFSGSRATGISGFTRTTGYAGNSANGDLITPKCAATGSTVYTYSIFVRSTTTKTVGFNIDWRNSSQAYLRSDAGTPVSVPANTTVRLVVTAAAPATAANGLLVLHFSGSLTATQFMATAGATVYDYFDGDSAGAAWDGTNGNSTSTLTISGKPSKGLVNVVGTAVAFRRQARAQTGILTFGGQDFYGRKQQVAASTGNVVVAGSVIGDPSIPQAIGYKPFWLGRLGLLRELPPPHYGQEVEQSYVETAGLQESLTGGATKDVLGYHREWKWTWRFLRDAEALPLLSLRTSPPRAPLRLVDSYSGGNLLSQDAAAGGSVSRSTDRFTVSAGAISHQLMPSVPSELEWQLDGGIVWQLPNSTGGLLLVDGGARWRTPMIPGQRAVARMWVAASAQTEVRGTLRPYDVNGVAGADAYGISINVPAPNAAGLSWRPVRVPLDPATGTVSAAVGLTVTPPATGNRTIYVTGLSVVHASAGRLWSPGGGAPEVIVTELTHTLPSPREHHMTLSLREV
jgi:hypothetical protein